MNKVQFDRLLKPLINIYDEIELDIIKNILFRLDNYNTVQGSLEWYLEKLVELGTFDKQNIKYLSTHKNEIDNILKTIVTDGARTSDYINILESYYDKGLLNVNPLELYTGNSINAIIQNALRDTQDIMNLIDTKVLEGAKESYKKIINKAYIETASGIYTYDESIRRALKDFAKDGIRTVHYENGRTLSIEGVIRRDVITRVNKLVGDIDINNAHELGTNLVYVDQHLGARIRTPYMKNDYEAHAEWQGKVYMLDGSSEKYDNFYEKTGYGEMLGLKGINCYHNFRPYFEWENVPERIDEEKNKQQYELLQKQRAYERKIRQLKRERLIDKENDKEEYKTTENKFKNVNKAYNKFLKENELNRNYSREYISETKKINIEESIVNNNNFDDITEEYLKYNEKGIIKTFEKDEEFEFDGVKYKVDNHYIKYEKDKTNNEKSFVEWFTKEFKLNVTNIPKINEPEGIKTPDFIIDLLKEKWDLKTIKSSKENAIYQNVRGKKGQTNNFMFDITNSKLSFEKGLELSKKLYTRKDTDFVYKILLKKDDKYKIIQKK